MERGALGSELDGNSTERRAIGSREDPRFLDTVYPSSFTDYRLVYWFQSVPLYCCNYSSVSYDSFFSPAFGILSLIRSELALEASVVL